MAVTKRIKELGRAKKVQQCRHHAQLVLMRVRIGLNPAYRLSSMAFSDAHAPTLRKAHTGMAQAREAVEQLAEMSRLGVQPDSMLGTALVDACARSGQMQMAQAAFEELFGAPGELHRRLSSPATWLAFVLLLSFKRAGRATSKGDV